MPRLIDGPNFTAGLVRPDQSTLNLLPPVLAERFNAFEDLEANAASALEGAKTAEASAREDFDIAKSALENLEARAKEDRTLTDYTSQISTAKERVDRARKRLDQKDGEVAAAIRRLDAVRSVAKACARKVEGARTYAPMPKRGGDLQHVAERGKLAGLDLRLVETTVPKGATLAAVSAEIDAQHTLRAGVANAMPPREQVERRLLADLDKAARRGEIGVSIGRDGLGDDPARHPSIDWPTVALRAPSNQDGSRVMTIDVEALVARHLGDAVRVEIAAKLDARYAGESLTLDAHAKAKRLREIDAKLLELERIECALIWQAIRNGDTSVFFRADADSRAVLGVA